MADIVLATLNAKYIHTAFGLRYLLANLAELAPQARLLEFDLQQRPLEVVETLLAEQPRIIGLGVYIWNASESLRIVRLLKRLRPEVKVVLGGPEVSYETQEQPICSLADYVIQGEADLTFAALCRQILSGQDPTPRIIPAPLPDLARVHLPYRGYTDADIAHRIVYVEASRGCPFSCEFCLSSLDVPVRQFPLDVLLAELQMLLDRGVRHFKFVDRTFNLNLHAGQTLLEFFHERLSPDLFLHFEMIPDRFPEALRLWVERFPAGTLQFEVGIQTFNPDVAARIHRRQDYARTEDNLRFLREETGVHLHADLIVGLPGETLESFAAGFDRLLSLRPQEIQVGILKRLRGAPISRHDKAWSMVYSPDPPYEILQNRLIDFATMQRLRRFARVWDLVANSGNFRHTAPLVWQSSSTSSFEAWQRWTDWLHKTVGRLHGIALNRLTLLLHRYLTSSLNLPSKVVVEHLEEDFRRTGRGDLPPELREPNITESTTSRPVTAKRRQRRQHRHQPTPPTAPTG